LLKHLFFRPEILSRLIFSLSDDKRYYVQATTRQKAKRALPEEIIRQLFVLSLLHDYKYPEERIRLEWSIQMGREKKRADIVVLDEDDNVLIILEIKVETDQHSMAQLKSYMTITGAKYGALISATEMDCIEMRSAREVFSVSDIPLFNVSPTARIDGQNKLKSEGTPSLDEVEKVIQASLDFPLRQLTGIEQFLRIRKSHADITIKGITLRLPIEEIDSYKTLRKRFLSEGVALNPEVKQSEWFALFCHLLESNPLPEQAFELNDVNLQKVAQVVLEAIAQGQTGFAGGWISSLELDKLLQEKRMEKLLPRVKRREMLNKLGYDWHPALREGRSTTGLGARQERPVLFITKDHHMRTVTIGTEIAKAYIQAQLPVVQPIISVASNGSEIHLENSTVDEERQLRIATPVDFPKA
jgi:Type I restriction enzyme R protein N terminus (HSDR_N)